MKALLTSVLVSVGLMVGILHVVPEATPNYQEMREAVWRMDLTSEVTGTVGFCSAVAIAPNLLLTAAHCDIAQDDNFQMFGPPDATFSIGGHPYKIVRKDVSKDLMLVYVDELNSPTAEFIPFTPKQDSKVYADGFPLGLVEFVTEGRVQDTNTHIPALIEQAMGHKMPTYLAVSTPIAGGNSGGGLFIKAHGHYYLIGICSMGGGDVALFVHPDVVKEFLGNSLQR